MMERSSIKHFHNNNKGRTFSVQHSVLRMFWRNGLTMFSQNIFRKSLIILLFRKTFWEVNKSENFSKTFSQCFWNSQIVTGMFDLCCHVGLSAAGQTEGERSEWSHPEVERTAWWESVPQGGDSRNLSCNLAELLKHQCANQQRPLVFQCVYYCLWVHCNLRLLLSTGFMWVNFFFHSKLISFADIYSFSYLLFSVF